MTSSQREHGVDVRWRGEVREAASSIGEDKPSVRTFVSPPMTACPHNQIRARRHKLEESADGHEERSETERVAGASWKE